MILYTIMLRSLLLAVLPALFLPLAAPAEAPGDSRPPVGPDSSRRAGVRLVSIPFRDRDGVLFAVYPHLLVSVPSSWDGTWRLDLASMTPGREEVVLLSDSLRAAVRVAYQPYDLGLVVPSRAAPGVAPDSVEISRRILSRMQNELRRQRGDLLFTELPPDTLGGRIFRGFMADADSSKPGARGRGGASAAPESASFAGYPEPAATPRAEARAAPRAPGAAPAAHAPDGAASRPGWIRVQVAPARETEGYYTFVLTLRERHPKALRRVLKLETWLAGTLLERMPASTARTEGAGGER
jgi:hypothetical protein